MTNTKLPAVQPLSVQALSFRFLSGLFIFALLLRVLYDVFATDNTSIGTWYDSGANIALSLLQGKGYVSSWEVCRDFQSFRTPVLPFTLGALWATFGYSVLLAKLFMAVVSAFTCVLLALLGERLFDARVGRVAGVAAALCSSFVRLAGTLGAETLTLFFLLAGVYLFCCSVARLSSWPRFFLSGLMFGLLCLTRPVWLPYVALVALAFVVAQRDSYNFKQVVRRAVVVYAGVVLVMLPWVVRNTLIHRTVVIASTEGGIAFLEANNPVSFKGQGDWAIHFAANQADVQQASRALPEAAFDRFMLRKGLGYVAADPANFGRVYLIRLGYLWRPAPPPQLAGDLSPKHVLWLTLWWGSLTALMIAAFASHRPWRLAQHWPLLLVLLWGSLIIPVFSSQLRYRAPWNRSSCSTAWPDGSPCATGGSAEKPTERPRKMCSP